MVWYILYLCTDVTGGEKLPLPGLNRPFFFLNTWYQVPSVLLFYLFIFTYSKIIFPPRIDLWASCVCVQCHIQKEMILYSVLSTACNAKSRAVLEHRWPHKSLLVTDSKSLRAISRKREKIYKFVFTYSPRPAESDKLWCEVSDKGYTACFCLPTLTVYNLLLGLRDCLREQVNESERGKERECEQRETKKCRCGLAYRNTGVLARDYQWRKQIQFSAWSASAHTREALWEVVRLNGLNKSPHLVGGQD